MPGSKSWAAVALAASGLIAACSNVVDHSSRAQAAGASGAAGASSIGGASPSSSSAGAAAGSVNASEGGNGPSKSGAAAGSSSDGGADEGNAPEAGAGGESSGAAGGPGSSPSCPAQPTTFQLTCEDVVERWSPSYAFDSSQWSLDANAAELPLESGSLTFFNAYSTSDFPICGVVPIEVAGKQLLATPTMDSHYLISAEIAQFQATDVCGNQYVFAPGAPDCGSITANEEGSWLGVCAKSCPGACN